MKKLFLSLVAVMMSATAMFAQSLLVATLTHGDEISMFYGTTALQEAHEAAANGDIINLSGGGFQSVKITKALTIRGTGVLDALPTTIMNELHISVPTDVTERLSFEGCIFSENIKVYGTLSNAYFLKNNIQGISVYENGAKIINNTFVNCNVSSMLLRGSSTVQFVNSYVSEYYTYSTNASASFINCLVRPYSGSVNHMRAVQLINCILCDANTNDKIPSTSTAWNCVAVNPGNESVFDGMSVKQNCTIVSSDIFIDGDAMNDLTDEAKAMYLGTDGTPIGTYGGAMPFNLIPTYPRITKMNVANKTTADGKLSVEIEVSAAE